MAVNLKQENSEFLESLGYGSDEIMDLFKHFYKSRKPYENVWKVLDAYDRGYFWEAFGAGLPKHFLKPDTNWVNYIKTSLTNSLYTGAYKGDVFPRSVQFKHETNMLNQFLTYVWDKINVPSYIHIAGERAALLNFGAIEIGWNANIIDRHDKLYHGDLEIKHIDNMSLVLDPSVKDYLRGRAIFIMEEVSLVELRNEKQFKERVDNYLRLLKQDKSSADGIPQMDQGEYGKGYYDQRGRESKDQTVRLLTCYYKYQPTDSEGYRIDQIWLIDDGYILDVRKDIQPKTFPIRLLYATPPGADPYGTPVTKLVLYNSMSINVLDSIDATQTYTASRRPRIANRRSGLNEEQFAREGNNPNKLWMVDGEPDRQIKYVDIPALPVDRYRMIERLEYGIMRVSGVDDRYTGRDTGSIQTTGGMDLMNQRISMSDNTRIVQLQKFVRELTELVLSFYVAHANTREYSVISKTQELEGIYEIDFSKFKEQSFDFTVNITPHLPNNEMQRGMAADKIMENQMQYQMDPPLITPEEWLEAQPIPQKHHILERMIADRMRDDKEELMSDIVNYAGMVDQGMRPEAAIDQLSQERTFKRQKPGLGNTGKGGTPQDRQR